MGDLKRNKIGFIGYSRGILWRFERNSKEESEGN